MIKESKSTLVSAEMVRTGYIDTVKVVVDQLLSEGFEAIEFRGIRITDDE